MRLWGQDLWHQKEQARGRWGSRGVPELGSSLCKGPEADLCLVGFRTAVQLRLQEQEPPSHKGLFLIP